MILKRIFGKHLRSSELDPVNAASEQPATEPMTRFATGGPGNVISLPSVAGVAGNPRFESAVEEAADAGSDGEASVPTAPARAAGVMSSPELQAFFARGHFPSGRWHGGRYKTQQALELGKREIVADFQLLMSSLVDQRQSKRDRVESEILKMQDFSAELAARLQLTSDHLDRQIAMLKEQYNLSKEGQGWVLAALNRYQLGFDRGVTDALDFDLLVA